MLQWIHNLFRRNHWRAHQNADQLWYFWGEGDIVEIGPYQTRKECVRAIQLYQTNRQVPHG